MSQRSGKWFILIFDNEELGPYDRLFVTAPDESSGRRSYDASILGCNAFVAETKGQYYLILKNRKVLGPFREYPETVGWLGRCSFVRMKCDAGARTMIAFSDASVYDNVLACSDKNEYSAARIQWLCLEGASIIRYDKDAATQDKKGGVLRSTVYSLKPGENLLFASICPTGTLLWVQSGNTVSLYLDGAAIAAIPSDGDCLGQISPQYLVRISENDGRRFLFYKDPVSSDNDGTCLVVDSGKIHPDKVRYVMNNAYSAADSLRWGCHVRYDSRQFVAFSDGAVRKVDVCDFTNPELRYSCNGRGWSLAENGFVIINNGEKTRYYEELSTLSFSRSGEKWAYCYRRTRWGKYRYYVRYSDGSEEGSFGRDVNNYYDERSGLWSFERVDEGYDFKREGKYFYKIPGGREFGPFDFQPGLHKSTGSGDWAVDAVRDWKYYGIFSDGFTIGPVDSLSVYMLNGAGWFAAFRKNNEYYVRCSDGKQMGPYANIRYVVSWLPGHCAAFIADAGGADRFFIHEINRTSGGTDSAGPELPAMCTFDGCSGNRANIGGEEYDAVYLPGYARIGADEYLGWLYLENGQVVHRRISMPRN